MRNVLDRDHDLKEKMSDALLKHVAHVASEELLDEMTDTEDVVFSDRHEKNMEKLFASMEPEKPKFLRPKRILILAAALLVLLAAGAAALHPTVLNFFLKSSDTNTEIRYDTAEPVGDTYSTADVTLGYVPAGMEMVESSRGNESVSLMFQKNEAYFQLRIIKKRAVSNLDNENGSSEKIQVQGADAFIQDRGDDISLRWYANECSFILFGNLSKDELVKIAENIQ